jgi:hypothetical protein
MVGIIKMVYADMHGMENFLKITELAFATDKLIRPFFVTVYSAETPRRTTYTVR